MVMNNFGTYKFHAAFPMCTQNALIFFLFSFEVLGGGEGGGRIFFIFHLFPTYFLQVPIRKEH
jgi:hypothetical protein